MTEDVLPATDPEILKGGAQTKNMTQKY